MNQPNPNGGPPEPLTVDPGNLFLNDLNTGGAWQPVFSTIRVGDRVLWQMTIRVGSTTTTVRTTKEGAESFSKMVAESIMATSPLIVPNDVPSLLNQMRRDPPGANSK